MLLVIGTAFEWLSALFGILLTIIQITGIVLAIRAILIARTPQAAIGWGLALVVFPYLGIPLFLIFGESRFSGYTLAGSGESEALDEALMRTQAALVPFAASLGEQYKDAERLALSLRDLPPTRGNRTKLLVDGEQTFSAIFEAMNGAKEFVVVQFYIVHEDDLGRELKKCLLDASGRGVRCWLLYDQVGSKGLPESFVNELTMAGVSVEDFVTNRQFGRHFQMNFRNHRKLVLVDGHTAFLGGLNAGDEYMGKGPLGAWRDTHIKIEGPAAVGLQVGFIEDWYYTSGEIADIPIAPQVRGDETVLTFSSGPAEVWNVTSAVLCEIIHDAQKRLWIASPYFVPDYALRCALGHAALRGVDVRIILPQGIDHLLPWLSSFTYYPVMREAGVRIWRYQPGFMHQKVLLADDDLACVGSINLDYRSFMLNFELGSVVRDAMFAKAVEEMFEADFARSKEENMRRFEDGGFLFRFRCRLASLMSPEQ